MMTEELKEMQPLEQLILRNEHHADWTTFVFAEGDYTRCGRRRIRSIEDGLKKIARQVRKIQEFAERTSNQELLAILEERLEVLPVRD